MLGSVTGSGGAEAMLNCFRQQRERERGREGKREKDRERKTERARARESASVGHSREGRIDEVPIDESRQPR